MKWAKDLNKRYMDKPTTNIRLNGEKLTAFPAGSVGLGRV